MPEETTVLERVAQAIARWDYMTSTHEEPDVDDPAELVLPPHIEIAALVIGIVKEGN